MPRDRSLYVSGRSIAQKTTVKLVEASYMGRLAAQERAVVFDQNPCLRVSDYPSQYCALLIEWDFPSIIKVKYYKKLTYHY